MSASPATIWTIMQKNDGQKKKILHKPENQAQFWFYATVISAVLWGLGGLFGALTKENPLFSAVSAVLCGVSSCCILASALLSLGERRGREAPGRVQRIVEVQLSLLLLAMLVFGECVALRTGSVSLSPMATLGMISLIFCVWIAGPKISNRKKFEAADILKVIILGCAATWLIAKFLSMTADSLM